MKAVPTALLALMAVLFLLSFHLGDAAWVGYLRSFSEAAMVGALADWFAVVALFRHPLGLPIPHTAIIPRRKDDLGRSLAGFIRAHFLNSEVVERRMRDADAAATVARWSIRHEREVASALRRFLRWALGAFQLSSYRGFLRRNVLGVVERVPLSPLLGRLLEILIRNRHHQELFSEALRLGIVFLDENREHIREHINRGSPWWLPGFIDDKIFDQMVERIQTQLLSMVLDPDHPLRGQFDLAFENFAEELQRSPAYEEMLEGFKREVMQHPTVVAYADEVIERGAIFTGDSLDEKADAIEQALAEIIRRSANDVLEREELRETFNGWLVAAASYIVDQFGDEMTAVISETVRAWDGQEAARRMELQVGRDLQFIRINGTLVGGLVGLAIHALAHML